MANLSDSPAGASVHGLGSALPSDSSQAYNEAPVDSPSNARSSSVATTPSGREDGSFGTPLSIPQGVTSSNLGDIVYTPAGREDCVLFENVQRVSTGNTDLSNWPSQAHDIPNSPASTSTDDSAAQSSLTMVGRSLTRRAPARKQPYFSIYGLTPFWPVKS